MKKSALAAALAVAALSLSACTSGTLGHATAEGAAASTPAANARTSAPATPSADASGVKLTGATPELQEWIERKHDAWVENYTQDQPSGADSVYIYMDVDRAMRTTEESGIKKAWVDNLEWKSPRCGEIVITVKGDDWSHENLDSVGGLVLVGLAHSSPELQVVTTVTEDGKTRDVTTRTDDDYLTEGGNVSGTCDA